MMNPQPTKTYGALVHDVPGKRFVITAAQPHVSIKLKSVFPKIPRTAVPPYAFPDTAQNAADLQWFFQRYPMRMDGEDASTLTQLTARYEKHVGELEGLVLPDYTPPTVKLKDGFVARPYQVVAAQVHRRVKRYLLADDMGLGKTVSAILSFLHKDTLPAAVVVQTHMTKQWKEDFIEKFTNLRVHIIKGTQPYNLPEADVYLFKYSNVSGWVNTFQEHYYKSVVFDEAQELRRAESMKYLACKQLASSADYVQGLSGTPIYNFGDEMYNVLDLLNPDCLGSKADFLREWCTSYGMNQKVDDPAALGTYLRENFLMLRRSRADVGRELKPVNKIIQTVDYDEKEVKKAEQRTRELAQRTLSGSFTERGEAARELDMLARLTTGVSKAHSVAAYVRMLLEAGEPVILAGWHRAVYDIWLEDLKDFNPVMYTGTESPTKKNEAKRAFLAGETNLFIISLRSGIGLDGLQHRCKTVVVGELDYSGQVHNQLIARADRDGQQEQVMAVFLVSDSGSDPVLIDLLGLKNSQSEGILNPLGLVEAQHSDDSRIKLLAQRYLSKHH